MSLVRRFPALPVAMVALVAALVVATPAHAGRQTTTDAAGDVYRVPNGGVPRLEPDNRSYDIVRAGGVHNGRVLTLWLQVRRLDRSRYTATWDVRTPTTRWTLHYDRRVTPAYTSLFHLGSEVFDCEGLRGRALLDRERVVVTVPRACLGDPRWVRFGATIGRETLNYHLIDDARLDAGFFSNRCKLGPRLRHN